MAQPPSVPQLPGSGGEQPTLVTTVPATPPPAETTTTVAAAAQSTAASIARVRATGKAPAPRPSGVASPSVAADDTASVRPGKTVFIDVLANDRNPDPRTLELVGEPREGDAEVKRRRVRYEADDDFRGVDEFRYRVCDVQGVCSVATVRVTVG